MRYSFSGHESFYCKSLWLKKGYDFLKGGNTFLDNDAVVKLGVGKNMVSSIRFWLKAFGLTVNDKPTELAEFIFAPDKGQDCFLEDVNTLWLLHYSLVYTGVASIYNLLFTDYQREKKDFDKNSLDTYIKRKCNVPEQKNVYNFNTVNKDIGVLLKNYLVPDSLGSMEDFSAILINLNLFRRIGKDAYAFNEMTMSVIAPEIILFAILDSRGNNDTISFDAIQDMALTFGMAIPVFTQMIREIEKSYKNVFQYTENSGIRNIHILNTHMDKFEVLINYYTKR